MSGKSTAPYGPAAHLDCTAGVAGDMLLGALVDAGADAGAVVDAVRSLRVPGLDVSVGRARRGGFACTRVTVTRPASPDRVRRLADVRELLAGADGLTPAAAHTARRTFELLAAAEARAHGTTPDRVHFHEVGAYDALADVAGCAAALDGLGLLAEQAVVTCSPLAAGSGEIRCAHGTMPVPVPAVLHIAARAGLALARGDLPGERTTPTGAALVAAVAAPGPMPPMTVRAVGTGGGRRDTPDRPNVTRVVLGETATASAGSVEGDVVMLESTVDDLDPRLWPAVLEALRAAGAWDCWTTGVVGRHGRPGRVVTALCSQHVRQAVADALLLHTTTLGVRWTTCRRTTLPRRSATVTVGPAERPERVTVKTAERPDGTVTAQPELSEAERAATSLGWSLRTVCEAAMDTWRREHRTADVPGPDAPHG
ncbi:nickel pincer cofactor biosynthesis protein LarC [Streptomyces mutabilis]|uniref:nickel pincer cofactor biosynthesis protein LarC n=1 Tax=Streptomyces mutabilis TaxID=67332 RepID=UPI0022BA3FD3|nr:nickel pincer cofactor biosynthesis protein LarC [Streptomyces mutabilis]MCZ9351031.1 nickel pincer cofactor biosynthesis protein LarC [Streptomyces mutabilis]